MKMSPLFVALVAATLWADASTAAEKPPSADYTYNAKESDQALAEYADCLVRGGKGQGLASAFVRQIPGTSSAANAAKRLVVPDCLGGIGVIGQLTMRAPAAAMRPALFAALYRQRFTVAPEPFADAAPLPVGALFDGDVAALDAATRSQLALGDCAVRADATAAHWFVTARPWSRADDAALPPVVNAVRGCLTTKQTLRLNRTTIRGIVAEALYDHAFIRSGAQAATSSVKN